MIIGKQEALGKIEEVIADNGAEALEVKVFQNKGKFTVHCIIDYACGGITVDNCASLNKKICNYLETSNILGSNYNVEVSSPGIDRALKTTKDFLRVVGRTICLWLISPVDGWVYLEAVVIAADNDYLSLKKIDSILKINFSNIKFGKEKIDFSDYFRKNN